MARRIRQRHLNILCFSILAFYTTRVLSPVPQMVGAHKICFLTWQNNYQIDTDDGMTSN